jgi:hypothetical protein
MPGKSCMKLRLRGPGKAHLASHPATGISAPQQAAVRLPVSSVAHHAAAGRWRLDRSHRTAGGENRRCRQVGCPEAASLADLRRRGVWRGFQLSRDSGESDFENQISLSQPGLCFRVQCGEGQFRCVDGFLDVLFRVGGTEEGCLVLRWRQINAVIEHGAEKTAKGFGAGF